MFDTGNITYETNYYYTYKTRNYEKDTYFYYVIDGFIQL